MNCSHCGALVQQRPAHINRAVRNERPLYCNRACAGLARRLSNPPPPEQKKLAKRRYDSAYRERNSAKRKALRAEYYRTHCDREKERVYRKANMHRHVEYCRRPEYKTAKSEYDKQSRASEYGQFAETYLLLLEVDRELRSQATSYERRVAKGYYTRNAQKRRRELWQATKARN